MDDPSHAKVICIGAGPAGLTAAYDLSKNGQSVIVLESNPQYVGGISRTELYKGYRFDVGGHRFFSKSEEIENLWTEILGNDLIERPRKSRIYYKNKLYDYPLKAFNALMNLGILESVLCVLSYARARVRPVKNPTNFRDWVVNQFGARLFNIFFKTYTEKVWGMNCTEISADWAAQRIKGLSLASAIWHAIVPAPKPKSGGKIIKTLISGFRYPRLGPGMMWDAAAAKIRAAGSYVLMDRTVAKVAYNRASKLWLVTAVDAAGQSRVYMAEHVISSTSIRELMAAVTPIAPPEIASAVSELKYRDFLTVALILRDRKKFDDNWIYIHEPDVIVGRIQNFKSWSPELVPDSANACYGLEYFCFEGDRLWSAPDADLIALGRSELARMGLADDEDILDGCVIRQPKAYPVYDDSYHQNVETVRAYLGNEYPTLHLVGRNGMHKYNNQDHAMMTALLTSRNIRAGKSLFDVWTVNQDAEYLESGNVPQT